MRGELHFDETSHRVRVLIQGRFSVDDLRDLAQQVRAEPGWVPGMGAVVDLRHAVAVGFSTAAFMDLAHALKYVTRPAESVRVALVVSNDFMYGLGRMWEAYSSNTRFASRVFRSLEGAEPWLDEQHSRVSEVVPPRRRAKQEWRRTGDRAS